jgi:hypothetical protein
MGSSKCKLGLEMWTTAALIIQKHSIAMPDSFGLMLIDARYASSEINSPV